MKITGVCSVTYLVVPLLGSDCSQPTTYIVVVILVSFVVCSLPVVLDTRY